MATPRHKANGFAFHIRTAKNADGMVAVHCPSGNGVKTDAAFLASYFARGRYSQREDAYIMTRAAAEHFAKYYKEGWRVDIMKERKLLPPAKTGTTQSTKRGGTVTTRHRQGRTRRNLGQ